MARNLFIELQGIWRDSKLRLSRKSNFLQQNPLRGVPSDSPSVWFKRLLKAKDRSPCGACQPRQHCLSKALVQGPRVGNLAMKASLNEGAGQ